MASVALVAFLIVLLPCRFGCCVDFASVLPLVDFVAFAPPAVSVSAIRCVPQF